MAPAKPGPLVGVLTRCALRYRGYLQLAVFALLFVISMQLLYLRSENAASAVKTHIFDGSLGAGLAAEEAPLGKRAVTESTVDSVPPAEAAPNTISSPSEELQSEESPEVVLPEHLVTVPKPTVPKPFLGEPVLLSADVTTVTADVKGNLGPPSVIVDEKMDDWLKDRWQAAKDMAGRPIPGPHWLNLKLANPRQVVRVIIDFETAYAKDYVLYASESANSVYSRADKSWFILARGKHAKTTEAKQHGKNSLLASANSHEHTTYLYKPLTLLLSQTNQPTSGARTGDGC